ncbi:MAG: 30S ribosomal protein S18 [Deltaproteobacteria bacterium]|jgi:SSU ribosomal protein S18P|uniref:Small ribosomal subunit protein bS18 n=1 Tax=Candidatus Acidulodesulfobacterium acidiphilum TaxID=2597224 RepID=A0A520XBK4_9DELT|nr:30S ribosomal protein S18 [Deltaproteobacteria bacterium]MCL6120390.1 30S ribosomal protein S18 [Deltaproteobacteria bacterium]MDA8299390.1 30S ribosomal protein S18 [Deltaproteobacteria bacterium]RZV38521.1 MAG: 30S ribosomal protein S18 [Candidatus Acidulodesulfobacterium acidiphilum]
MNNFQNKKSSKPAGAGFARRTYTRKKICRFCADESLKIDYKDSRLMRNFVSERGKIMPRRITGNCAYHQRRVSKAIKMSRTVSIMPYTSVNI